MFLQTQCFQNSSVFLLGIDMGTQYVGFAKANLKDKKIEVPSILFKNIFISSFYRLIVPIIQLF